MWFYKKKFAWYKESQCINPASRAIVLMCILISPLRWNPRCLIEWQPWHRDSVDNTLFSIYSLTQFFLFQFEWTIHFKWGFDCSVHSIQISIIMHFISTVNLFLFFFSLSPSCRSISAYFLSLLCFGTSLRLQWSHLYTSD